MKGMTKMFFLLVGLFAVAVVISTVSGCGEPRGIVRPLTEQEKATVEASNQFGFGFFGEVVAQSDGGNLFVSPLSVSMALGMTYNGARGTTEEGMRQALVYGERTPEEINEGYRGLIDLLTHLDPKVKMEIANSIWFRQGFDVLQSFIDVNQAFFAAMVRSLDFSDPGAVDVINSWVSEKTHGKIEKVLDRIGDMVVMYLINAIYFKGDWTQQFDKGDTHADTFHVDAENDKTVQMMKLHADIAYLATEDFQAVDLPYGDGLFSMTVLLPREGKSVDELIADLTRENWEDWRSRFRVQEGDLSMPRFELEYGSILNDVLIALGMGAAFDPLEADFSGITPEGGIFISRVIHKTYVRVDEEGTEAAAVTVVEVEATSVEPDFFVMKVDRPFLFVISDSHSGTLLFLGKIVDPPSE